MRYLQFCVYNSIYCNNDMYEGVGSGGSGLQIIQANAIRTLTFNHMLYYDRSIPATSSVMEYRSSNHEIMEFEERPLAMKGWEKQKI